MQRPNRPVDEAQKRLYEQALEEALLRGLCEEGAREVAAEAIRGAERTAMAHLHVKRVYDEPDEADGTRVLVDRLWPRGLRKEDAKIDVWSRELAPSDALRRWYGHDAAKLGEFSRRYRAELQERGEAVEALRKVVDRRRRITLLTATRELALAHTAVLREFLARELSG